MLLLSAFITTQTISKTSGLNSEYLNRIPAGAEEIVITKVISPDSLYEEIYSILLSRGHRIDKDDKERYYLTTEGNDVGESTLQRMVVLITEQEVESVAKIKTEWKPGTTATIMASSMSDVPVESEWTKARWENNRLGIAFGESVVIAKQVEKAKIEYR